MNPLEVRFANVPGPDEEVRADATRPVPYLLAPRVPSEQDPGQRPRQRLPPAAVTASASRWRRNQVRIRSETSMTNFGSRGPCGVRG